MTGTNAIGPRLADDPEAFQEAYEHLSPMVLDYVRRFVPRDEAEDVRQQVFLEVWRSRSRFDADRKLEPWVLAIAKRRSIDHIRRQARNLSDPVEVLPARRIETEPHFVDTITEADEMRAALSELSARPAGNPGARLLRRYDAGRDRDRARRTARYREGAIVPGAAQAGRAARPEG